VQTSNIKYLLYDKTLFQTDHLSSEASIRLRDVMRMRLSSFGVLDSSILDCLTFSLILLRDISPFK
jgi:hypothetical protein